jgi:hypothetical protein
LSHCGQESTGGIYPEQNAQGREKPWAAMRHAVDLGVGYYVHSRDEEGWDEERLGRMLEGGDEGFREEYKTCCNACTEADEEDKV